MNLKFDPTWQLLLQPECEKPYFHLLSEFVDHQYKTTTVFPPQNLIFSAFDACPFDDVKVVILGQDPYHEPNQANGLCFSVQDGVKFPPSLKNIFKELENDLAIQAPHSGNLLSWARQGVLLLNATLTVRAHEAGSHQNKGWEKFTDAIIHRLAEDKEGLVFMLWGSYAQRKGEFIDDDKHLVLSSVHPSPLSAHRGFFGNHHFSLANEYLVQNGQSAIDW